MAEAARISFEGVSKSYGGVRALSDVSFEVRPGCVHALVGENGAGKSTLMKILSGAVRPESGVIRVDGGEARLHDVRDAQALGIAIVHQEFTLAPHLSVSENVFLGRWPRRRGLVDFGALHRRTEELLRALGLAIPVRRRAGDLPVARQQMVEIAKALSQEARILILDEPSAALTPHEARGLMEIVRGLVCRGVSVLYISHRLEEIFELADFVTVLRDGRHVSTRRIAEVDRATLIRECVGRPLEEEFPARPLRRGEGGEAALRVKGLGAPGRMEDVTFEVCAGEVFALTGLVGSGRTSVARAIFGALPGARGEVLMGAARGPFRSVREAKREGVAMAPEDRKREGLLLMRPVRENITLADTSEAARGGIISLRRERAAAREAMSSLRIKAAGTEAPAWTMSGGNQQKAMLARWLRREHKVMILDEPTRGVDVGARAEIYGVINRLAAEGAAVLMITSEMPEAIGMADRIGVMCRGRLTGILDNAGRRVTQERIMALAVAAGEPGVGDAAA